MRVYIIIALYLISIVSANILVKFIGAYGLLISSFLLIPFDYVARCYFHEKWSGKGLLVRLFLLTWLSCIFTYAINKSAENIALASVTGFTVAQVTAGIYYQLAKKKSYLIKVNGSDFLAIISDSIVFQFIAFGDINMIVLLSQVAIKLAGGFMWYYLLFKRLKIQDKL